MNTKPQINILFKDDNIVIAEKYSGLLVHPYTKYVQDKRCLMKMVRDQVDALVYPVHRLDRPVSGIVIFGLQPEIVTGLQDEWHKDTTVKEYTTLVKGDVEEAGQFNFKLRDGKKNFKKRAVTNYQPIHKFETTTLCKVQIETGRRHQIRRHFSRRMHNVIGDTRYGYRDMNVKFGEDYGLKRIFLHSNRLEINHPITGEHLDIRCPMPESLTSVLTQMGMNEIPKP